MPNVSSSASSAMKILIAPAINRPVSSAVRLEECATRSRIGVELLIRSFRSAPPAEPGGSDPAGISLKRQRRPIREEEVSLLPERGRACS